MTLDQLSGILEVSKGLLTPLIAMVAVYIAWQQWRTNQLKVTLDRYDRRFRVYEEVVNFLTIIRRNATIGVEDIIKFQDATSQTVFLFGSDVCTYIDEIHERGVNLHRWSEEIDGNANNAERKNTIAKKASELRWLSSQFDPAKEKFKKYLDISGCTRNAARRFVETLRKRLGGGKQ